MATPDVEMHGSDSDSALSEPLGTDTLEARSMVPGAYRNNPDAEEVRTWVWVNGRQFLKVDHAANIRYDCRRLREGLQQWPEAHQPRTQPPQ